MFIYITTSDDFICRMLLSVSEVQFYEVTFYPGSNDLLHWSQISFLNINGGFAFSWKIFLVGIFPWR